MYYLMMTLEYLLLSSKLDTWYKEQQINRSNKVVIHLMYNPVMQVNSTYKYTFVDQFPLN